MAATWTWEPGDAVVAGDILFGGFSTGRIAAVRPGAVCVRWPDGREEHINAREAARRSLRKPN